MPELEAIYNRDMGELEAVLEGIERKGDFCASGAIEAPIPRLEIKGLGLVSFPLPQAQAKEIEKIATQAPYGRGEETILDTSVRRVWQLEPGKFSLGGSSWPSTLESIVTRCVQGMGCQNFQVRPELYKLLLYAPGGFFKPHKDTEKSPGMFGTLVVSLPSLHEGGELQVRHAGREERIQLNTDEPSEINFAAFFADCEHEVKPVTRGYRLCLIYNLIQVGRGRADRRLTALDYSLQITKAAELLRQWAEAEGAPPKLAYLLSHEYSPAGLSFTGLKNRDAGVGEVLREAARKAGLMVHLGIVHLTEMGPAEIAYEPRRWRRYSRYEERTSSESQDFTVIEVSDSRQYISDWRDTEDRPAELGEIPLGEDELLPEGALNGEKYDEQRVTEATGNEGATFERAYHRAAIVFWPAKRHLDVLLQSGVVPAVSAWAEQARAMGRSGTLDEGTRANLERQARSILAEWENERWDWRVSSEELSKARKVFLHALSDVRMPRAGEEFIRRVLTTRYDGTENTPLATVLNQLEPRAASGALADLITAKLAVHPTRCTNLLRKLTASKEARAHGRISIFAKAGQAAVEVLRGLGKAPVRDPYAYWRPGDKPEPMDAKFVAELMLVLHDIDEMGGSDFAVNAAKAMVACPDALSPREVLSPGLKLLSDSAVKDIPAQAALLLWQHAAKHLLARGEFPPEPPRDWAQKVSLKCNCKDCAELSVFASSPTERTHRFTMAQDRRFHVESQIRQHDIDMTCATETKGRPQTLVATKTREHHRRAIREHQLDLEAMGLLIEAGPVMASEETASLKRMQAARTRGPQPAQE